MTNNKADWERYVVLFDEHPDTPDRKPHERLKNDHILKHLEDHGAEIVREGEHIRFVVVKLPNDKVAKALEKKPFIKKVVKDKPIKNAFFKDTGSDPLEEEEYGWKYQPEFRPYSITTTIDKAPDKTLRGDGVKILVLDTGMDATPGYIHEDIKLERYIDDFVPIPEDAYGHSTSVVGAITAQWNGFGTMGIAPNARVFLIRISYVTVDDQLILPSAVSSGLDWAIKNGIDIVNMSFAFSVTDGTTEEENPEIVIIDDAIRQAYSAGLILVAAAGNDGDDNRYDTVNYPAVLPEVLSISAARYNEVLGKVEFDDRYSSYGKIDFMSASGFVLPSYPYDFGVYVKKYGTSFAAPTVCGLLALYKQVYPHYTRDQLISLAKSQAQNTGVSSIYQGAGYMNAPQTKSGYTLDDLSHGVTLYQSISGSSYHYGNTIKVYSRVMDDPANAPSTPKRPYAVPFEGVTIRHDVYDSKNNRTFTIAKVAGTDGRFDYDLVVDKTKFPAPGTYTIYTRTSYTDPVTGQYLYTYTAKSITIS